MPLITMMVLSTGVRVKALSAVDDQGIIAIHYNGASAASWTLGQEPAGAPYLELTIDLSNVTDIVSVAFSVAWDPKVLNLTEPIIQGNFLEPPGPGGITTPLYTIDYVAGYLKDYAYTQLAEFAPKDFPLTTWGWVATLKFEVIATPAFGEPIDTDIVFINEPPKKPTYWATLEAGGLVFHDFAVMSLCHFHYEALKGKLTFDVPVDDQIFYVTIETNSSVSNFAFNEKYAADGWRGETSFNVTGPTGTTAFCNVTIPKNLTYGDPSWRVLVDGAEKGYTSGDIDATSTWLYFTYTHGATPSLVQIYGTRVVPEFSSPTLLITLIVAALALAILAKRERSNRRRRL